MSDRKLPIIVPVLGEEEAAASRRVILSGWVTQGPEVAAFEKEFAAFVGASFACAVSSCTTALHLALLAAGVKEGDEVITVSHSFIATANAIRYCGAIPVFVDIEPATYNIDPLLVEQAIGPRTKAILCVHQGGMPCDLAALVPLAARYSLPLIEDAACAAGSEILWNGAWEKIGKPHGDIACFSFHPRKLLTTGDGGMLTTRNAEYDRKFRLLRQHAMSVPDTVRHQASKVVFEEYTELGYNYRMTDIQAAVGREQLKRLPELVTRRRALVDGYRKHLGGIEGLGLPHEPETARSNWQSFMVQLPSGVDQVAVMQSLLEKGVASRRGIMCSHREPAYRDQSQPSRSVSDLRLSEQAQDTAIILPLFHSMTGEDQQYVAAALQHALSAVSSASPVSQAR